MNEKEYRLYLSKYIDKFDENFPSFLVDLTEEETIEKIKECLKEGKPFKPEIEPDCYY